jgi:transmembrane sensor
LSATRQRLAWTDGKIDFDGTLAEAVAEFNRYNRRQLQIVDASVSARHIQGLLKATDPDAFAQEVQRRLRIPYAFVGTPSSKNGLIRIGATE